MTLSAVDFASLLCSRLCHDLLSPVGALNNGLELLADETDPAMRARCMELLADSARTSAAKLKFFRLAFGAAGGFGEAIDPREAKSVIEGLFGDKSRLTIEWLVEDEQLPRSAVKVLCIMAMIAGDALVRGGRLDVGAEAEGGAVEIVVRATGPRLALDEELRATLVDGHAGDALGPRAAPAYLVHALVAQAGGRVMVTDLDDGVLFGAAMRAE